MSKERSRIALPKRANLTEVLELASIIWGYHRLDQPLKTADALFAFGSNDVATARYAASLFLRGLAPWLVMSGGQAHGHDLLATGWDETEAEVFAREAALLGVSEEFIVLEARARNTKENFLFSAEILAARGISMRSAVVVHKPFMERRTYVTGAVMWPQCELSVTSIPCSFETYVFMNSDPIAAINVMVGDLQRLWIYAKAGDATSQSIPGQVMDAFTRLVELGFDRHVVPGANIRS